MNIEPVDFIVCGLALDVVGIVLLISFGFPATYFEGKVTILEMHVSPSLFLP